MKVTIANVKAHHNAIQVEMGLELGRRSIL